MKKNYSFSDDQGRRWTACCECNRGGNGFSVNKCACGWRCKQWNGLGCYSGERITVTQENKGEQKNKNESM